MKLLLFGIIISIFLNLSSTFSFAQFNLVPNGSFESFDWCPQGSNQLVATTDWDNPLSVSTPDYFHSCSIGTWVGVPSNVVGYQSARTGQAYAGIVTSHQSSAPLNHGYREYIQCQLIQPLLAGESYFFQVFLSGGDSSQFTCNDFGVYFSNNHVQFSCPTINPCNITFTPQLQNTNSLFDRINWIEMSGTYIATGGEEFLIMGNFKDSITTVMQPTGWSNFNSPFFYSYFYIDDVLLTPFDSITALDESLITSIKIYPTVCTDNLTIESENKLIENIVITNMIGNKQEIIVTNSDIHKIELSIIDYKSGSYILHLNYKDKTKSNFHKFFKQ